VVQFVGGTLHCIRLFGRGGILER